MTEVAGDGPGVRLEQARKLAGLSLTHAAEKLGRSRQTVRAWEQDPREMKAGELARACSLYGISLDQVMLGAEGPLLSPSAKRLGREFDALPWNAQRQVTLVWSIIARKGVPDPVGRPG